MQNYRRYSYRSYNFQFRQLKYMLLNVNVNCDSKNSDKKSVIAVTRFLLKVTERTFQQKVHSSVTCFKKVDLK